MKLSNSEINAQQDSPSRLLDSPAACKTAQAAKAQQVLQTILRSSSLKASQSVRARLKRPRWSLYRRIAQSSKILGGWGVHHVCSL